MNSLKLKREENMMKKSKSTRAWLRLRGELGSFRGLPLTTKIRCLKESIRRKKNFIVKLNRTLDIINSGCEISGWDKLHQIINYNLEKDRNCVIGYNYIKEMACSIQQLIA